MPLDNQNGMLYWGNNTPVCPRCDCEIDINEWELYGLYEEGGHDIECPYCEKEIHVVSVAKYTFSTDEQPEE